MLTSQRSQFFRISSRTLIIQFYIAASLPWILRKCLLYTHLRHMTKYGLKRRHLAPFCQRTSDWLLRLCPKRAVRNSSTFASLCQRDSRPSGNHHVIVSNFKGDIREGRYNPVKTTIRYRKHRSSGVCILAGSPFGFRLECCRVTWPPLAVTFLAGKRILITVRATSP